MIAPLIKNLGDGTPDVREGSYQSIAAFVYKMAEIRDCATKLAPAKPESSSAAPKQAETKPSGPVIKKPETAKPAVNKMKPKKVVKGGAKKNAQPAKPEPKKDQLFDEKELDEEEIDEKISSLVGGEVKTQLMNTVWKERNEGLQALFNKLKMTPDEEIPSQAIIKFMSMHKPGFKDSNFNCLKQKFAIVQYCAENSKFSMKSVDVCLKPLIDKIGDIKCGKTSQEALTAICENTSYPVLSAQIAEYGIAQKSPKTQAETLKWLANSLVEFGMDKCDVKVFISVTKTAFAGSNVAVRKAGLDLTRSLALFLKAAVMSFFQTENKQVLSQIEAVVNSVKDEEKPKPPRGAKKKQDGGAGEGGDVSGGAAGEEEGEEEEELNVDDLVTRIDISGKLTEKIMQQMSDSKWKERKEALDAVQNILSAAKFVEGNLGDLPDELKKRFK